VTLALILVPIVFAMIAALTKGQQSRNAALLGLGITTGLAIAPFFTADNNALFFGGLNLPWLPNLGIGLHVGMDSPAASLVLLTAFLGLMSAIFSKPIGERENEYYAMLLTLVGTVIGAFVSLDLVLFYIFFEICLVPAYFLIGIWGGKDRVRAATKFFVYTVVGSLVMLVSIIALYLHFKTFDLLTIQQMMATNPLPPVNALFIFAGFAVAFAVKTGLFPLHTWLPDAYTEAPAPITAFLSGAMAKLGTYGLFRFGIMLLPEAAAQFAPVMVTLGVVSILYGALVAASQRDAKRVIAYSSISHLGYVVAGLFALNEQGIAGAFLQQINHGITSAALFLAIGLIQYRRGTTKLVALGGLWEQMPVFGRFLLIFTLSSVALPLTNGFVGEFLILLGTYSAFPLLGVIAAVGVVGSAIYMLVMFQKAMYGEVDRAENRRLHDLNSSEFIGLAPFVALIFLLGIVSAPVLNKFEGVIKNTLTKVGQTPAITPLAATTTEVQP